MSIKQRSKNILDFIAALSDQEFEQLLIESGIEYCPLEEVKEEAVLEIEPQPIIYKKLRTYSSNNICPILVA